MYLEISNPMDYQVTLYIRLSKEDENEGPFESITNQKSLLNGFVQQHCLSVYNTNVDDGWSGTNFERPNFQRMIDKETFQKMSMPVNSCKNTRSRTYDFLLEGLICCHECGYPMAVHNRLLVSGKDRLFFVCRIYQRFTKADVYSCNSIKEQVVTEAILAKVGEVFETYLNPNKLQPIAADAVEKARQAESHEAEIQSLHSKNDSLTANLDKMYMDRLTGLLAEVDFERIYQRVKMERSSLEEKFKELEAQKESSVSTEDQARELVQQFLGSAYTSRELLVSLIERVELTEDKQIIIKFCFCELEAIS